MPISYKGKNYEVYPPEKLKELTFDKIFISVMTDVYELEITNKLKELGINKNKIDLGYAGIACKYARLNFIKTLSLMQESKGIKGNVAELGVWRGETAKYINEFYMNDEFYLLDTFEGFSSKDIEKEKEIKGAKEANSNDFSNTSIDFVKTNLTHLEKCHFIKGYFPQSTSQMNENLIFKFVNIDVDLYQPILAGLEYFYPRLATNGVILVHDYFHPYYTGTKQAVDEFCAKFKLKAMPIGDAFSVFIMKE